MKRWFLIRHLRWLYLQWSFQRWWLTVGRYHWLASNLNDELYLDAVWRGEE